MVLKSMMKHSSGQRDKPAKRKGRQTAGAYYYQVQFILKGEGADIMTEKWYTEEQYRNLWRNYQGEIDDPTTTQQRRDELVELLNRLLSRAKKKWVPSSPPRFPYSNDSDKDDGGAGGIAPLLAEIGFGAAILDDCFRRRRRRGGVADPCSGEVFGIIDCSSSMSHHGKWDRFTSSS